MLSGFTWVVILIVLVTVKYIFILPYEDKQLFELYEVRDDISIAVMQRKVDQNSQSYKFVIDNINFWIYNTQNDYDFSVALSNIVRQSRMKQSKLDSLIEEIEKNPILARGLIKLSIHSQRIMRIKGKLFWGFALLSIKLLLVIVKSVYEVCNIGQQTVYKLSEKLTRSKRLKAQYDYYADKVVCRR